MTTHALEKEANVSNPDVAGVAVRQLRLPPDVLLLELVRENSSVVVSGQTTLQQGDDVVLVADPETVEEVRMRMGG